MLKKQIRLVPMAISLVMALNALPARADDPPPPKVDTVTREHTEDGNDPDASRFSLFGGLGLGFSKLNGGTEVDKSGLNFEARVTGSLYNPKMVFDFGLGWMYSRLGGSSSNSLTGVTTDTTVITQAGFFDFSPRFRLKDSHLELGLLGRVLYGADASFGEDDTQNSAHVLIGPKAALSYLEADIQYRFGLQLITDITIRDRQIWSPLVYFEIGIPLFKNKTIVRETETTRTEYVEKVVEVEKEKIVEKIVQSESTLVFDDEVVHFEISKATLYPESRNFFAEVGRYLAQNQGIWKTLTIGGHTDATGNADKNMLLSKQRAGSVARVLVAAGVPAGRIKTAGYGQTRPVDPSGTKLAWARNRRVEISFGEGANSKLLHDEITKIKLRTIKPRTCEGNRCK